MAETVELPRPPAELSRLADVIGAERTLKLIELRGGSTVFVANPPTPDSLLTREIGIEAATALAQLYGRCEINIPVAKRWRARVYRTQGMTVRAIALRLGLTEQGVRKFVRDLNAGADPVGSPKPVRQLDLFPGRSTG